MRSERAWFEFWLPILSGLGQQCYHSCKDVRQAALVYLQRALLSNDLESNSNANFWSDCFDNVLFPLLEELLKKEIYNLDPNGMDETMARASALMCKIFLHYFSKINTKELERIWSDILQYLCRYLVAAKSEFLVIILFYFIFYFIYLFIYLFINIIINFYFNNIIIIIIINININNCIIY